MAKIPENVSEEKLATDLVQGDVDINDLNLAKKAHRNALMDALKKRKAILRLVKEEKAQRIFSFVLTEKPEYFLYLDRKQYTEEFLQAYLFYRFQSDTQEKDQRSAVKSVKEKRLLVQKNGAKKLLLTYMYTAEEGDELYYFDKELGVPLAIKYGFKVSMLVNDAMRFIDEVDVQLEQLGLQKVKALFDDTFANRFKAYVSAFMKNADIGFYSLCTSVEDVEEGFKKKLNAMMESYGVVVSDFFVKKLAIPQEVQEKIEDQELRLRLQREEVKTDSEFAKISLENYKEKLALEEKYPQGNHTLTEYEKDLALKRYLIKVGRLPKDAVNRAITIEEVAQETDKETKKDKDVVPEEKRKLPIFKFVYLVLLAAFVIAMIAGFSNLIEMCNMYPFYSRTDAYKEEIGTLFIELGVGIAVFGTVAAFNLDKFKKAKVEGKDTKVDKNVVEVQENETKSDGNA